MCVGAVARRYRARVSAETADPEDRKIVLLARTTRSRTGASEGAAVRDRDGRTYTAAAVDLPSLQLSALALAVAMAASSGATGLEAAAVVTGADAVADADLAVVRDLAGEGVPVWRADTAGTVLDRSTT
jgi:hypothetical protein